MKMGCCPESSSVLGAESPHPRLTWGFQAPGIVAASTYPRIFRAGSCGQLLLGTTEGAGMEVIVERCVFKRVDREHEKRRVVA